MLFTRLRLQNIYCFSDAELDFTFPRKVNNNLIPSEHLPGREKFNVRRVIILSGANASGKTSLGKILCGIQNFICRHTLVECLSDGVGKEETGVIDVEFVNWHDKKTFLHSLYLELARKPENNEVGIRFVRHAYVPVRKQDSAKIARERLQDVKEEKNLYPGSDYLAFAYDDIKNRMAFEHDNHIAARWNYVFNRAQQNDSLIADAHFLQAETLSKILRSFDPSIKRVSKLIEDNESKKESGFNITFDNGDNLQLTERLRVAEQDRLSSGTLAAIDVAKFYARMMAAHKEEQADFGTYFLDEKMAYAHSELEQAILNLLIHALPAAGQLFYTTHNSDILEMGLPLHAFIFLRKYGGNAEFVDPSHEFNKNDRTLLNYVKNNVFCTLPDTSEIEELLYED